MLKQLMSLVVALALAGAGWFFARPQGRGVEGVPHITDGDSLKLNGIEIRLKGVDAPEMRQSCRKDRRPYACGEVAREALIDLIGDRPLTCRITGRDRYRRSLAACSVNGQDIGAWLVERGFAVGYRDYEREEARARARSAGLWAGEFQRPEDWRREQSARG